MSKNRSILFLIVYLLVASSECIAQSNSPHLFRNPLLPAGADPWVIYRHGFFYYTSTGDGKSIRLWKTGNIARLKSAVSKTVWMPPPGTAYSKDIWAPELHYLHHKWYLYFAADDGINEHHRLYVLENASGNPLRGVWKLKGKLNDPSDKWAIDGSVFETNSRLYLIWSGWEGNENGEQDIYIAKMKNPYTVDGTRVKLSSPTFDWEKYGDLHDSVNPPHVNVNEAPEMLQHKGQLFLVYSANGCWTDHYLLGILHASKNADMLDPHSWIKSPQPAFLESPENSVYGPGHCAFFQSPDGKEDWIIYHAHSKPGLGCDNLRSPRAQKFGWNKDGSPNFGIPVNEKVQIPFPSGSR